MKKYLTIIAIIIGFAFACQSGKPDSSTTSGSKDVICPEYKEYDPVSYQDAFHHFIVVSKVDSSKEYFECLNKFGKQILSDTRGKISIYFLKKMPDGYEGYLDDSKNKWMETYLVPMVIMYMERDYEDSVNIYFPPF